MAPAWWGDDDLVDVDEPVQAPGGRRLAGAMGGHRDAGWARWDRRLRRRAFGERRRGGHAGAQQQQGPPDKDQCPGSIVAPGASCWTRCWVDRAIRQLCWQVLWGRRAPGTTRDFNKFMLKSSQGKFKVPHGGGEDDGGDSGLKGVVVAHGDAPGFVTRSGGS